ncbi:MAG: hypothetical protein JRJ29_20380 [Deltaproteobacteria bacterium]|nr:hypothetical protein [Deltaproteobacteria bacterium]
MNREAYFKDVIFALEKALYYERGRGAYFRSTMVGVDFLEGKDIAGNTLEEVVDSCIKVLIDDGIIKDATYHGDESGSLFTFELTGCIHFPIDKKLKQEGVPPFVNPPINMILSKVRERTGLAVEIADINFNETDDKYVVNVVVFEPKLSSKES